MDRAGGTRSGGSGLNIELHIERLILDGLSVEQQNRAELQAAVEAELTRLLMIGGLRHELLTGGAVRSLGAGEMFVPHQMNASRLGSHIAQALHTEIGRLPAERVVRR